MTVEAIPHLNAFLAALDALAPGYHVGWYQGERWDVTVTGVPGDRMRKLYGKRLAGGDHVSFNLYTVGGQPRLKPCEMPAAKVLDFVLNFVPAAPQ